MHRYLLCGLTILLVGCDMISKVPVRVPGATALDISLGETLSSVRAKRPDIEYVPYAGWLEQQRDGSPFTTVLYQFGNALPGEKPDEHGRLRIVRLTGSSIAGTNTIVRRLDHAYGAHQYYGCTPVLPEDTPEEIAILRWNATNHIVVGEVLMSRRADGVRVRKPIVITVAQKQTAEAVLGSSEVEAHCFSREHIFD